MNSVTEKIELLLSQLNLKELGIDQSTRKETPATKGPKGNVLTFGGVVYNIATPDILNGKLSIVIDQIEVGTFATVHISDTDKSFTRFAVQCAIQDLPKTIAHLFGAKTRSRTLT